MGSIAIKYSDNRSTDQQQRAPFVVSGMLGRRIAIIQVADIMYEHNMEMLSQVFEALRFVPIDIEIKWEPGGHKHWIKGASPTFAVVEVGQRLPEYQVVVDMGKTREDPPSIRVEELKC